MEKSIASFTESLDETFRLSDKNWKMYSPLTLAYIGDGVYDLVIRTIFVKRANCQPQKLHQRASACVNAKAQSRMIRALRPLLTEEEDGVYRRGRNSKPYTKAKNATMEEYLDLQKEYGRLIELVARGLEEL